jgi:hypothetical protein
MRTKRIATVLVRERTRQLVWHVIGAERPNRRAQVAAAPDLFGRGIGCAGLAGRKPCSNSSLRQRRTRGRAAVSGPTADN